MEKSKILIDNIENMKDYSKEEISCSERLGIVEDYSQYQEQKDLQNYRSFMNSSDYDAIKDVGIEISNQKKLTRDNLRKISAQHEEK